MSEVARIYAETLLAMLNQADRVGVEIYPKFWTDESTAIVVEDSENCFKIEQDANGVWGFE